MTNEAEERAKFEEYKRSSLKQMGASVVIIEQRMARDMRNDGFTYSDDSTEFEWRGWRAARAASPVSAPKEIGRGIDYNAEELLAHPLDTPPYPPMLPKETDAERNAARFYEAHPEFWIHPLAASEIVGDKDRATIRVHKAMAAWRVAAPSVASEDSATQPVTLAEAINLGRESWQAKHGKCSMCALGDVPVDGLHRGKHKCGNEAGSAFIPGSEDWMRKAARSIMDDYEAIGYQTEDVAVDGIEQIIREHYGQAPEGK